jgi:superfamily II DNA or RNA helicase/HKD family nuclease
MGNDGATYRRVRIRANGFPVDGLYDSVVDTRLQLLLQTARAAGIEVGTRTLGRRDGRLVARELSEAVLEALEEKLSSGDPAIESALGIVNGLLREANKAVDEEPNAATQILPLVLERIGPQHDINPPDLSDHGLLTGREATESLLVQLKRELGTCDRVDWLVSFIKLAAVRMLQPDIEAFLARGGTMRVVTTAYMGATDPRALEQLAAISISNGSRLQIRFSRESDATRLHAKAYIHRRESGFGSAYIGSANLSRPALTEGLEWTVRLSQAASPGLWTKIEETFEQWWGDPDFVEYGLTPGHPTHAQFQELVAREKGACAPGADQTLLSSLPIFDLQPKPFQQAILDRIAVERHELGRTRHLVVAATGTGKTMIAAFDYRDWASAFVAAEGRQPRMLYIAHSERILRQARLSFAQVMRNLNFGGLLVGGHDDRPCDALFASIQSWNSRIGTESLPPDHFDYVVVDEVHRGEAPSWRKLLEWIRPKSLLGLTATPERADGLDITRHFEDRITAEIRLPEAIARRLLVPFHYFGVTDTIDLRDVDWTPRGYKMEIVQQRYLQAGPQWIENVRRAILSYVAEPLRMRAIGFCSGVLHARAMADEFERLRHEAESRGQRGVRAEALDGQDSLERREEVIGRLRRGETQVIFVADLFNEGVDIPEVDTVFFMRPTDSLTVYVQQLGRGLRLCPYTGKDSLTVLDFVGQYRREFRFDDRLSAMLADPSASVESQVKNGFSALPPGCSITLERIAREQVLANIRSQVHSQRSRLIESIKQLRDRCGRTPSMRDYLEATRIDPRTFYEKSNARYTWFGLLHGAGLFDAGEALVDVKPFISALRAVASITDRRLIEFGLAWMDDLERGDESMDVESIDRRLQMLLVDFGDAAKKRRASAEPPNIHHVIEELRSNTALRRELRSLLEAISTRVVGLTPTPVVAVPEGVPLALHRVYTSGQLFAAFGLDSIWRATPKAGVAWIPESRSYIMLVTLEKDADSFTERTRYRDYAISPSVFHWQSQATARPESGDGTHVVEAREGTATMWLFIRRSKKDDFGTEPYVFMGAFTPTTIEGMRPMSVTGNLANAMPAEWFEVAARAR